MKKEQNSNKIFNGLILLFIALTIISIVVFLVFQKVKTFKTVNENEGKRLTPGLYATYAMNDKNGNQTVDINLFKLETGENYKIFNFRLAAYQSTPLFKKYNSSSILINRLGEENRDGVIKLDGEMDDNFFNPGYNDFLLSPSGNKLAFIEYNDAEKKFYFSIRDNKTGEIKRILNGSWSEEDLINGQLRPIYWTTDEKYVYADQISQTEGYIVGLTKIDSVTMEKSRVKFIDELGMVNLSIDNNLYVYGFNIKEYDPYSNKYPSVFYRFPINRKASQYEVYELKDTKINSGMAVDLSGRFVTYSYSKTDGSSSIYIYDLKEGIEKKIPESNGLADGPFWQNNLLLFATAEESAASASGEIHDLYAVKVYDSISGETKTIDTKTYQRRNPNNVFKIIGWFKIDK